MSSYGKNLNPLQWSWRTNSRTINGGLSRFERCGEGLMRGTGGGGGGVRVGNASHSSTVEKLYAWEKKLYLEVKVHF